MGILKSVELERTERSLQRVVLGVRLRAMIGNILATRYELSEQLAEGLLFSVYRARDLVRSQVVTVKVVRPPYADNPTLRERLAQIVETRKRLQHPNLATLYGAELEETPPFLVEEFIRALDLATRIRRTAPFTVPIAVEIMIGIVEGLEALHRAGVTHTDLRPANVLVGSEWHVWLNGVGMRTVYQADATLLTQHEARAIAYTAPEILQGGLPSPASDLYACGVILYEMLTASLPFRGDTPLQIAQAHLNNPIPSLREVNPAVPRAVEGIVLKCLQKDPNARYPSALSLLNDLKGVRDALRFGKPLGWSPMDTQTTDLKEMFKARTPSARLVAESEEEDEEEEIPRWLRTALRVMTVLVLAAIVIIGAAWMALRMVPEDRPIPPVVGKPLQEVNRILIEQGFNPEVRQEGYSEEYPMGVVYSVSPPQGRMVRKGTTVYLWVSKGSRMVQLPDVRNLPEARARSELEQMGIAVLSTAEERRSDTVPFGYVIDTIPPPGTRIDRSRPVKLVVSIGMLGGAPSTSPSESFSENESRSLDTSEPTTPPPREFIVKVDLTDQPDRQVRVEVQDAEGTRTVVEETKPGGQVHEITVRATGQKVRIRVYIDNQLVQEINR